MNSPKATAPDQVLDVPAGAPVDAASLSDQTDA
jgi:hypothetical protein